MRTSHDGLTEKNKHNVGAIFHLTWLICTALLAKSQFEYAPDQLRKFVFHSFKFSEQWAEPLPLVIAWFNDKFQVLVLQNKK